MKRLKRIWLALRGRKPRAWDFAERDIPAVLRRYDDFRRTQSAEASWRLWAEIGAKLPETKGVKCGLKVRDGGVPYVEEVL